jgi:hypothetical protein
VGRRPADGRTTQVGVGPDGTAYFSGVLEQDDSFTNNVFGVVPPGQEATLTACIGDAQWQGAGVQDVFAVGDAGYAVVALANSGIWGIARVPQQATAAR